MTQSFKNFINGEWVAGVDQRPNINPSDTSDVIGLYAQADAAQTETAIAAAQAAFPGWAASTPQQRFDVLDAVGNEILARREEIGRLLSREEGKTLAEGMGETHRAAMIFKFFAAEALRCGGEVLASVRPGVSVDVLRQPVGVVGLIAPWNFPIAIPAWKIAPALAYGNCVVFKPAELVPGCAWTIAEILSRTALPKGVFNLVMGSGSQVGQTLVDSRRVKALSFTGSVATGRRIIAACAARQAKVQAEMGGKNPLIVLDDADLNVAVNAAVQSAYFSTGQRCTASSRVIVTEGIHDRFIDAVVAKLKTLTIDHALKAGTDIGPVVDQRQLDQNLRYVDIAKKEGGTLVWGGEVVERATMGFYQMPALITNTTNEMTISREEVFGPVANVVRVKDYDEALAVANDTEFGLSAGICTQSLKYASHFKLHAEAGMVMINLPTAGVDYHVPFGGSKGSSYGSREQGTYAREFYTTVKTAYTFPG
ncbi:aldehyde dehydrogenase family protein [Roseateles amylovorans]|uniref:Aldehyde dehydrogenase family protein n=1 Tax=Roseateles amylovorans TaxID=2978473 RepID=A0ABY6B892_9BURK|nr:aldehyde dehydrogenase family protein [Roseateles amylovorans]UXH80685.1 aldehyde dehydrogenase family protein [Roseateles amylovorans]